MISLRLTANFAAVLFSLSLVACDDHDHDHDDHDHGHDGGHERPSVEEDACEHMKEGPAKALTASADAAGAPDAKAAHTRLDVALVEFEGERGGLLTYAVAEAGDYVFFLERDIRFALLDATNTAVRPESTDVAAPCGPNSVQIRYGLEVGTYTLRIGPVPDTTIGIVIELDAPHDHDDDH